MSPRPTTCSSLANPLPATVAEGLPLYVEVSPLRTRHLTGIGRFAARLIEALARITPLRLITTVQGELAQNMRLSNALACGQDLPVGRADVPAADEDVEVWARRLLRRRRARHDPRLAARCAVLYTLLRPAQRHFRRELCLLYDFTPLLMPAAHVRETRENFGALFARDAALCDKLLAISHSTRADARWLCAARPEDVVVGYPGPTLCVHRHAHPEPVARRQNVILVVSTLEPRKNGLFLFRWFLATKVLGPQTELWWVGPSGWLFDLVPSVRRWGARCRKIKFLGVVADRRLCQLYREATFTIYPSLYEGFGLPVLDALRHGTPVVSSFNSSLQEFAGPGVFYFDACDEASLDAACREVLAAQPAAIDPAGLDARYSWDALARKVVALCA